jgi:uncharacterized protein (DUF3820 family)
MITIGFATEFYTLWDVVETPQYKTDAYGKHWLTGKLYVYRYIKNISTDINKVKELYPNAPIDEYLRGITNKEWNRTEKFDLPSNYITFGKYNGRTVEDVAEFDFQYLLWLLNSCNSAMGKHIKETKEYKDYETKSTSAIQEKLNSIKPLSDGIHKLTVERNPRDGRVTVCLSDNHTLELLFAQTKECFYNGYSYEIPVIGGKAKRIKGKSIEYNLRIKKTDTNYKNGCIHQIAYVLNFKITTI